MADVNDLLSNFNDMSVEVKGSIAKLVDSVESMKSELEQWKKETKESNDFITSLTQENMHLKKQISILKNDNIFLRKVLEYYSAPFPSEDEDEGSTLLADNETPPPPGIVARKGELKTSRTTSLKHDDNHVEDIHGILKCDRNGVYLWSWNNQPSQWKNLTKTSGIWLISPLLQLPMKLINNNSRLLVESKQPQHIRVVLSRCQQNPQWLIIYLWKPQYSTTDRFNRQITNNAPQTSGDNKKVATINEQNSKANLLRLAVVFELQLFEKHEFECNSIEVLDWPGFAIGKIPIDKCFYEETPLSRLQVFRSSKIIR